MPIHKESVIPCVDRPGAPVCCLRYPNAIYQSVSVANTCCISRYRVSIGRLPLVNAVAKRSKLLSFRNVIAEEPDVHASIIARWVQSRTLRTSHDRSFGVSTTRKMSRNPGAPFICLFIYFFSILKLSE